MKEALNLNFQVYLVSNNMKHMITMLIQFYKHFSRFKQNRIQNFPTEITSAIQTDLKCSVIMIFFLWKSTFNQFCNFRGSLSINRGSLLLSREIFIRCILTSLRTFHNKFTVQKSINKRSVWEFEENYCLMTFAVCWNQNEIESQTEDSINRDKTHIIFHSNNYHHMIF